MLRSLVVVMALAAATTSVMSQDDVIAKRQAIYKSFGRASRDPGAMLKGAPFELAKVQEALRLYSDSAKVLPALFPDTSKTGGNTEALPAIWEDKPKFNALLAKFDKDSTDALASIKDEASFKAEFPKVLGNCGTCHNTFRKKS